MSTHESQRSRRLQFVRGKSPSSAGMLLGVSRQSCQVAENTTVHVRIAEAKNLRAMDVSGTSDPFCTLRVDNIEVARTATVWRTLDPFWGEDFTLHMPRGFRNISIYVYDEDVVGQNDIIGKLSFNHDTCTTSVKGIEEWFALEPVLKDEEIQGEIEVSLCLPDENNLKVHILQARGLAAKDTSGTSDPFVKFTVDKNCFKTEIMKKTRFPRWNQTFLVPLTDLPQEDDVIELVVWDWDRLGQNDFMGLAKISLGGLVVGGKSKTAWYRLRPRRSIERHDDSRSDLQMELGSLRVMILVREDIILPSRFYKPLLDLLVESVQPKWLEYANVVSIFKDVMVADRTEMATILVKLYLGQGKIIEFLDYINAEDLKTSEKATLFRGNSFATKANDQFMKVVGSVYLRRVLKSILDIVFEEKKNTEIDPTKLELHSGENMAKVLDNNTATLAMYIIRAITAITQSSKLCPPIMRLAFKKLRQRVERMFPVDQPGNENTGYLAISGFLFLRFFAPAILAPKLFFLRDTHADKKTARTLTLIAKAIQNMGNLGSQLGSAKELFMKPLHPLILDNVARVKEFLDDLVDISDKLDDIEVSFYRAPLIIREGWLQKRKRSNLYLGVGAVAFQRRYFWLSRTSLQYAKSPDVELSERHTLNASRICAVELVDHAAFQTGNVFQVVYQVSHTKLDHFYFVAKDVNEQQQWLSALRKVCLANREMFSNFHPGAHRHGKWSCCLNTSKMTQGCSKAHAGIILGDYQDPLDPEAEAQTIFSQLWNGFDKIRSRYYADRPFPSPMIQSQLETIDELSIAVPQLASGSSSHKKLERFASAPDLDEEPKKRVVRLRSLGSITAGSEPNTPEANSPDLLEKISETAGGEMRHNISDVSVNSCISVTVKTTPQSVVVKQLEKGDMPDFGQRLDGMPQDLPKAISERLLDELERLHAAHTMYDSLPRRTSVIDSL